VILNCLSAIQRVGQIKNTDCAVFLYVESEGNNGASLPTVPHMNPVVCIIYPSLYIALSRVQHSTRVQVFCDENKVKWDEGGQPLRTTAMVITESLLLQNVLPHAC
jgi:hypothetical protein